MENKFFVDSEYLSPEALEKKHRLENDPKSRSDHMEYLPGILSGESRDVFMGYFKEHLKELFAGVKAPYAASVPQDYVLNHMVCDFAEAVQWWSGHTQYSPEEISGFFFAATQI